jgi:uncharacterized protein YdhG (YjbR/CyaY superfamily)
MAEQQIRTIDEYIAGFPPEAQTLLRELRALIGESAPQAAETISYGMPTFDLSGRHLIHFAGYAKHVGLYPVPLDHDEFKRDLAPYRSGTAAARFRLGEPLPAELVRRIVRYQVGRKGGQAQAA